MSILKWRLCGVLLLGVMVFLAAVACGPGNGAPTITSLNANPASVGPGQVSTVTCIASDPDDDTLSYQWKYSGPSIGTIVATGSVATWTAPSAVGTYTITVTVTDGRGGTIDGSCSVTVAPVVTEGSIDLKSSPSGARVYVDGEDTGNITPYVIEGVAAGQHTIELTLYGHKNRSGVVTVEAGKTKYVNWPLEEAEFATVTIEPSAALGKDAEVFSGSPGVNMGSIPVLEIGNVAGNKARSYIQFSLPEDIPATAIITEAALYLWYGYTTSPVATTLNVYQVTELWAENNITWDGRPAHSTLRGSAALGSVATGDFVEVQLQVALVEGWIDGSIANRGLVLIDANEVTIGALKGFCSSDHGTDAQHPKLLITYYDPIDS